MNGRPILGLLAIGALALVLLALGGGGAAAGAGRLPACPETWPEATGYHEGWYVIIDQDSNGNKHGRAYPANAGYDVGYVPAAPWETCIVRIKGNPDVEQVGMSKDSETSANTPWDTPGNQLGSTEDANGQGGSENPTPEQQGSYSISPGATAVEGQSAALTLTLSRAAPAGGAQFTVTPGYDGDATAAADDVGSVTSPITVSEGDASATITIPTVDDAVDEDDETFTVTVAAVGDDWTKAGVGRDTATVTITDDDTSGVTVNAANPVRVNEGASATYTVALNSRPTANVSITAVSTDADAAAVDPTSYTFTPSQWNTPQTFTVSGVADDDTNDESVAISHRVTSADAKYAVALASTVRVAVSDTTPAQPGSYSVSPQATAVEGQPATLTLTLSRAAPAGGAQFTVTPGYDGDATAAADDVGRVTSPITVSEGDTSATIAIPTVDDAVDEDDETFTVTISARGDGWIKAGVGRDTATVTITDDDTSGVTVNAANPVRVNEGASATYTVALSSRPTANVSITAVSNDADAALVSPTSHTFTPSQWNTLQTFRVLGVADDDTNDERVAVSHRVTSGDAKYAVALASTVRVAVTDTTPPGQQGSGSGSPPANDPTPDPAQPGSYAVSPRATAAEGQSASLTLTLSRAAPAGGAQFTVTPGYAGNATAAADDVGRVTSPIAVPEGDATATITIPTVDDAVDEDDETFTVTVAARGDGWIKAGVGRDIATVTITDDDASGVTVNAANPVRVNEGATATYTVVLNSRPTANVSVTAVSNDADAAAVSPTSRTFTPSQWNVPQTFTVRGVADDDTDDESVAVSHRVTSADAKYAVVLASTVRVAVSDTTPPDQQGSGSGSPPANDPTRTPNDPPPSSSGSGNRCPSDYRHKHNQDAPDTSQHWHQWSIDQHSGQCLHSVGHSKDGIGYHEH